MASQKLTSLLRRGKGRKDTKTAPPFALVSAITRN